LNPLRKAYVVMLQLLLNIVKNTDVPDAAFPDVAISESAASLPSGLLGAASELPLCSAATWALSATRLLQMLVSISRFVVGFVLPTQRYRSIMYQYITNNDRYQRQKPIIWICCLTKVMHLVSGE
jgi:hypothetical protein